MNGKGFFAAVVRRRRRVLALYAAAAVLCALLSLLVSVNYDINDYLPPDAPSTIAIDVMEEAFGGGIPNVRAMVRDVTVPEALAYKQQIARVEGVTSVTWLDDVADVTVPLEMQDPDTVAAYYKDGAALFTITVSDDQRAEAVAAIDSLLGDAGALTGSAVSTAAATNSTVVEVAKIAAIAVLYVVFILALTTASWAEPALIMVGMGAAILINNGTNLIFGEISFVTSAAGSILQLAVSLDYSVFLIHRFAEVRAARPGAGPGDCMVEALTKSASSILSSGLTTVIGFAALVLMQFQIGPDLGLALAKGVAFSLLTVFTFVPALVVTALPWMDKTHHKPLLPSFTMLGGWSAGHVPMVAARRHHGALLPGLQRQCILLRRGPSFAADTEVGGTPRPLRPSLARATPTSCWCPPGTPPPSASFPPPSAPCPRSPAIISYVDTAGSEIPPGFLDDAPWRWLGTTYGPFGWPGEREAFALGSIRAIARNTTTDAGCRHQHLNPRAATRRLAMSTLWHCGGNYARSGAKPSAHRGLHGRGSRPPSFRRFGPLFPFLNICRGHGTAIRIGVNHGSLSDRIMSRYGDTPEGMVASCMEFLRICRDENFPDVVISIKASNTVVMVQTVRLLVRTMDAEDMHYPLHLGVTEAGEGEDGRIKSAVGIGTLLPKVSATPSASRSAKRRKLKFR